MQAYSIIKEGYTVKVFLPRCNCHCSTCPYKFVQDRDSIPQYRTIRQVVKQLRTLMNIPKAYYLEFTGGEPMLVWENIIEVLNGIADMSNNVFVRIHTNGTMQVNQFIEKYNTSDFGRKMDSIGNFVNHCNFVFHIPTPVDDDFAADMTLNMETNLPRFVNRKLFNDEDDGMNFLRFSEQAWKDNLSLIHI